MGVSWTPQQQKVIDLRNRNILVSAAAGSGKTAVLVERIKERVLDKEHPVDIDEMLVVTFTKAAAAQMRERVSIAIEKELLEHPSDVRLQQQLALAHNAQITTIDSFCLYVIRNHFHEIDIEPNFRIADEGELKLLKQDVMERMLEQRYQSADPKFLEVADIYASGRSDDGLKDLILQLYQYAQSYPWPKEWLRSATLAYKAKSAGELLESEPVKAIFAYLKNMIEGIMIRVFQCMNICEASDGPQMYLKTLVDDSVQLQKLCDASTYEELSKELRLLQFARLSPSRGYDGDPEKLSYVKNARDGWKKTVNSLKDKYFFLSTEEFFEQLKRIEPVAEQLVELALAFTEAFDAKKRDKNLVDFGDLEHFALQVLVDEQTKQPTDTAVEFQNAYAEIMIDEYQDSNYVQETILRAISREARGENNLFMVGDVKQSIYRFRLARPELFMEKYDTYSTQDGDSQRIDLSKNFRSRDEILEITNHVFEKIMNRNLGNVEYDTDAALYPGAAYPKFAGMFEPEILIADSTDELLEEIENADKFTLEAMLIADRIKRLLENQLVTDKVSGELRKATYGDIVILLRSLSSAGDEITRVLMEQGIPAHTTSKTGYFSTTEVQTVLNYLRLLDNPLQDIPLAAVLRSPIAAMTEEELALIAVSDKEISFADAFFTGVVAETLDERIQEKAAVFYRTYQKLRSEVADRPIHELLLDVLKLTGYQELVAAMPAGRQRQANIDMLIEKAIAYEGTSYRGLYHFIRYIDELQKYDVDFGEAELVSENEDAVRIMSIHKSKGLEFPIVFVSGLGKAFNKQDSRSRMILHPQYGLSLDEISRERRLRVPTLLKGIFASLGEQENLGEELRILYVAFTRPQEKLILTGVKKDAKKWFEGVRAVREIDTSMSFLDIAGAGSYLDWIVPALMDLPEKYPVKLVAIADMVIDEAKQQIQEQALAQEAEQWELQLSEKYTQFIEERLAYEYPYQNTVDMQMKYSVSELKHRAMRQLAQQEESDAVYRYEEKPVVPYVPEFMNGRQEENQGVLRGTAMHRILECIDFAALEMERLTEDVAEQISQMLTDGRITADMAELVSQPAVVRFLQSDIAALMQQAAREQRLFREKPFVLGMQEEELVLVQGIIDVFWIIDDKIYLLDYKTDRISSGKQLVDMYREQLELYTKALETIWKKPVAGRYLYSFCLSETLEV